jgi:hypothetical protein
MGVDNPIKPLLGPPSLEKWNLTASPFRVLGIDDVRHWQVGERYFRNGLVMDACSFDWRTQEIEDRFPSCLRIKGGRMPGFLGKFRGIPPEPLDVLSE